MKKRIYTISFILIGVFTSSFISSLDFNDTTPSVGPNGEELLGEKLFLSKCKGCHGKKGTWFLMAKRLSTSTITAEQATSIITNGNGGMPSFKDKLSKKQISSLATFIQTLKEEN